MQQWESFLLFHYLFFGRSRVLNFKIFIKIVDLISFHKISSKKIYFLLLFLKKNLDFFIIFVAIKVCAIVWACCFCS